MNISDKLPTLPKFAEPEHCVDEATYHRLNSRALRVRLEMALDVLCLARPAIEADARMMADLTRFFLLPAEAQIEHERTEHPGALYDQIITTLKPPSDY